MNNSVLCAVDVGSNDDDVKTIQMAARLAAMDGAQLDVIAVVPDYGISQVGSFFSKDHHATLIAESKERLNKLVVKSLDTSENDKVRHVVGTGRIYEEVLKLADKSSASLIVVGAHKSDFADYLLGPNAARIVRHAKCSVYVVR